jgi:RNA polymerase sigma-70 factor (ECF subfamily)
VDEVHSHDAKLKAYLRSSFPTVQDVDDVVQESYLRIWKARTAQPILSAKAFLFKIASRLCLDRLRHEQASPITEVTDFAVSSVIEEKAGVFEAISVHQEISLLLDAIDSLPDRCREILILRKLQGIPQKEVAARLGISEQTVHVQVARGIHRCEACLIRKGVEL